MHIPDYIAASRKPELRFDSFRSPWDVTNNASTIVGGIIRDLLASPDDRARLSDYHLNTAAYTLIHRTADIHPSAILQGPVVIEANARVAPGAFLRGGVYLGERAIVGFSSEVKSSFLFEGAALGHLNFVGDSLIGKNVNFEAGSIAANCSNTGAHIKVVHENELVNTGLAKFGAMVGDYCNIGANAVLREGTILEPSTRVPRLAYIDQRAEFEAA
jgi:NDP-sugar pyrophosphorylase family protein